jgi:hypothetical protein
MYQHCIFCSAKLGENEVLEHFPVGERLAFDAWKGRLWVVCPKCGRWNLSPLEERWEAVEEAEKGFRDSRLRVHSENVGLAKLPDGTRLIRVGEALPGELAAWRYGDMLRHRRYRHWMMVGGGAAVGIALVSGMHVVAAAGMGAVGSWAPQLVTHGLMYRKARRPVLRLSAEDSPTGEEVLLRRIHLNGARLVEGTKGPVALHLPGALGQRRTELPDGRVVWVGERSVVLEGEVARSVLSRAMVDANERGASQRRVDEALSLITRAGGPEEYVQGVARESRSLGVRPIHSLFFGASNGVRRLLGSFRGELIGAGLDSRMSWSASRALRREYRRERRLGKTAAPRLALEMALHEESERRALQGELAALEAAWREAEEIARIADALPEEPPALEEGR